MPPQNVQRVLHKLEVHQVELEVQNEALREAQNAPIDLQQKYADLFYFAPIGYFAFDRMGLLTEVSARARCAISDRQRQ